MNMNDRLVSVGGQATYPIWQLAQQCSPTWYQENYYVDGNVSATGDGNMDYPFSTMAEALAASSAAIALSANRYWARRNAKKRMLSDAVRLILMPWRVSGAITFQ